MTLGTGAVSGGSRTLFVPRTLAETVSAVAAGALTVALLSQRIDLGFTPVPVTLQTLGILLVSYTLGARLAAASLLTYLLAGAAGAPVFSGFAGGLPYLLSSGQGLVAPTVGYLLAFPVAAHLAGGLWEDRRSASFSYAWLTGALAIGYIYLGGFAWHAIQRVSTLGLGPGLKLALVQTVWPFLLLDMAKAAIAAAIAVGLFKRRCRLTPAA
ncbi:MAG: biotin transporter BioY [Armatimonadetes bacterium]|nr:biotin transporter BioY [Armatimonadota bacterium]